jgi:alpha-ketoglutaric semialdehyde dehydrogenase
MIGQHFIAGQWTGSDKTFLSAPVRGPAQEFCVGTPGLVEAACSAAEAAFDAYAQTSVEARAGFLNAIADEIEARAEEITETGSRETGLPEARLQGERGRTTEQLRLFAKHILKGDYLDRRHDPAMPNRQPLPRPELRMIQRPIGPVAVFGASNFPLAFSVAGGDTASALAAGCPVVVKGHSAHPGTSEIVARAIEAAMLACDMPSGVFSLIQGGRRDVGTALVTHALIRAVGFTGSLDGGRALFNLCAARPDPIPFFGELGSVNPVFILPGALSARGAGIAQGWASSLTMGTGQFCTNPGVVILPAGPDADAFSETATGALLRTPVQMMLTEGIAEAYRFGCAKMGQWDDVQGLIVSSRQNREAAPCLYRTTGAAFLANPNLHHEVFGPLGLIVEVYGPQQMQQIAAQLEGQLTCTLHMNDADTNAARALLPLLERKAGRILFNGFPTGVEVCDAMVHGGPYPASTNFGHTSVGTLSIRRWLRPVCYQDVPDALMTVVEG